MVTIHTINQYLNNKRIFCVDNIQAPKISLNTINISKKIKIIKTNNINILRFMVKSPNRSNRIIVWDTAYFISELYGSTSCLWWRKKSSIGSIQVSGTSSWLGKYQVSMRIICALATIWRAFLSLSLVLFHKSAPGWQITQD